MFGILNSPFTSAKLARLSTPSAVVRLSGVPKWATVAVLTTVAIGQGEGSLLATVVILAMVFFTGASTDSSCEKRSA
jgi:hypothetical protein